MAEKRVVGGCIVTQDGDRQTIYDGELGYDDATGRVSYVGERRGPGGDLDATDCVVLPGLTNGHTHSGMTPLRGYADDSDLQSWLGAMRAFEVRMTHDDIRAALQLAMAEMIRTGTTCFVDMFLWDTTLLADVAAAGMRLLAAPAAFSKESVGYPSADPATGHDVIKATAGLVAEFAGDGLVKVAYGPHAPYSCAPDMLREVAQLAVKAGVPIHTHLSETAVEVAQIRAEFGCSPIEHVRRCGLFETHVHGAHAVHVDEADIAILRSAGASISHNPVSNMKLGAGIAPLPALRAAGITTALGTDSAASNNSLDMFEEIKTAAIVHRGVAEVSDVISAAEALDMATREGAAAAGFTAAGRLEVGSDADFIVLRADTTRAVPLTSPVSFLVFAAVGTDVRDVVVAGRELMRGGVLLTIDETAARQAVAATAKRIFGALQL